MAVEILLPKIGFSMQEGQIAVFNDLQRVLKHLIGFRRETGNDVGTEGHIWAKRTGTVADVDHILTQMAALHAFQDHIIPGLQAEVKMRHQARFFGDELPEVVINLDRIEG